MVSQLFLAVTNQKHTRSHKRDASGNYVDANPYAKAQTPKYTLEQWHTITHDVELEMHPETLLLKEGVELSEDEINELRRQRRMERQPQLSAELDQIVMWLHDLLMKKGRKTIQEIVRAIQNRETRIAKPSTCYSKCGRCVPIATVLLRHLCVQGHSCFIAS